MGIQILEDGTRSWKPNPGKQEEFIRLPDDIFEGFYGGAAGGGKTEALLMLPIAKGYWKQGEFRAIFFRRTYPQLESSLISRAKDFYEPLGAKYNETKHTFKFPSGATFKFAPLETDADARKHDTNEYHYVAFEELTEFSEFQYTYITSRIRKSTRGLPTIIRGASNPGNVGHSWVRARFVEPEPTGMTILYDPLSNTKRIFIPAKVTDNPALLNEDPNYVNRLKLLPEADQRAKIHGDWWAYEGQVFRDWRYLKYPNEPDNALHVIEPFPIPFWWPKIVAIDWGYAAMTWVGWGAIAPDGRLFIYREYAVKETSISTWGAEVAKRSQFDETIRAVTLDPSAWQERGQVETIAQQFHRVSGMNPDQADNDRLGGKMLIHDYIRWNPRPSRYIPKEGYSVETAQRVFRLHGSRGLAEYEKMFKPEEPETNIPLLQVFNTCPELIRAIPLAVYDEKKKEDIKEFNGDDPLDGLRYLLKRVDLYKSEAAKEAEKHEAKAKIMTRFEETRDYNDLHRSMERYESEYSSVATPAGRRSGLSRIRRGLSYRNAN